MAKILLGVTGSVAAIHTPLLFRELREAGHDVKVVATSAAVYFFDPTIIGSDTGRRSAEIVILDEDEWPGRAEGHLYARGDRVVHIELRRWADLFLIAPLDANTLAKLACGICDNCLTCVWRAWDPGRRLILAPAMNTLMWENPLTLRHMRQLAADASSGDVPKDLDLTKLMDWINCNCATLTIVPPITKLLACADVGVGAMAERAEILKAIAASRER